MSYGNRPTPRVKGETTVPANGLTQHQRGEAGMGQEGGRDWEGMQDRHAEHPIG